MAGPVLLKIVSVLTCRILGLVVLMFRGDRAKDDELLVLRRENAVLRRQAGRVRYEPADRVWFAALARLVPRRRWAEVFPVCPATVLAWHRRLVAKKYDTSRRRTPGQPPAGQDGRQAVMPCTFSRCPVRTWKIKGLRAERLSAGGCHHATRRADTGAPARVTRPGPGSARRARASLSPAPSCASCADAR